MYYPIVKPWAGVELLVDTSDKIDKSRKTVDYLKAKADKYLYKDGVDYKQRIHINSLDSYESNQLLLRKYSRTISPFRIEMFCTKGYRWEYDEDMDAAANEKEKEKIGASGIGIAKDKVFYRKHYVEF